MRKNLNELKLKKWIRKEIQREKPRDERMKGVGYNWGVESMRRCECPLIHRRGVIPSTLTGELFQVYTLYTHFAPLVGLRWGLIHVETRESISNPSQM